MPLPSAACMQLCYQGVLAQRAIVLPGGISAPNLILLLPPLSSVGDGAQTPIMTTGSTGYGMQARELRKHTRAVPSIGAGGGGGGDLPCIHLLAYRCSDAMLTASTDKAVA